MPIERERNGDFSELLERNGGQYQIYNPYSGHKIRSKIVCDPFPGNIIPAHMITPIAKAYTKYYSLPNNSRNKDFAENLYLSKIPSGSYFDVLQASIDHQFNSRHRTYFRWHDNYQTNLGGDWTGTGLMDSSGGYANTGVAFDHVYLATATTILNFKAGWGMNEMRQPGGTDGFDPVELGFPAYLKEKAGGFLHMPVDQPEYHGELGQPARQP